MQQAIRRKHPRAIHQFWFILFCLALFVVSVIIIRTAWHGNDYFAAPFQVIQDQHPTDTDEQSLEPQSGTRESDIKKVSGSRFKTY